MMYGGVGEMGVASQPSKPTYAFPPSNSRLNSPPRTSTSMSQGFHQAILSFPDRFIHGSVSQEQPQHVAQQSIYDKLRVHGFDGAQAHQHPLVPTEEERGVNVGVYESPGGSILSDMFNFAAPRPTPTDLLAVQISGGGSYRSTVQQLGGMADFPGEWHGVNRQGMPIGGTTNPQPRPPWRAPLAAALHSQPLNQSFSETPFAGGMIEVQGLSLSLSSSQQPFEIAKAEEPNVREGALYFNSQQQEQQQRQQLIHMSYAATGAANVLRNSKYSRAAQELLEEFCSVGKGLMKGRQMAKSGSSNPNPNESSGGARAAASTPAAPSSCSKDINPLSPSDRFEHQRKKTKLIAMLDAVGKRYNHYCDQMQMVVNFFDSIMGFGSATPYTSLAQKAMSRHFRCLKDSIAAQLKHTCELLGDKEGASNSGLTKGETPKLRLLDQTLRQQRAFHQMGMMDQEAWRSQRGLPEPSVNILRAWLFEHFLHPYPSDADKHLLARQTGLSRNQVSNWFINARVRLWKPMVEDMYQQEFKDEELGEKSEEESHQTSHSPTQQQLQQQLQQHDCRPQLTNAPSETEPSPSSPFLSRHHHRFAVSSNNALPLTHHTGAGGDSLFFGIADSLSSHPLVAPADDMYRYGAAAAALVPAAQVRFGSASSDISLTLGLQQGTGGNAPDSGPSSSPRDF